MLKLFEERAALVEMHGGTDHNQPLSKVKTKKKKKKKKVFACICSPFLAEMIMKTKEKTSSPEISVVHVEIRISPQKNRNLASEIRISPKQFLSLQIHPKIT